MSAYLDLASACREKGVSLSTVRRNALLQPLLGYSEHLRGRKRYWPKHVVEEWKGVFDKQLPVYARRLMGTENLALVAHVKEVAGKAGIV